MSTLTAYAELFRNWEVLLLAIRDNADSLPSVERHRRPLEEILAEARSLEAQQDSADAVRQEDTQKLATLVATGKKQAADLLGVVRADLGPDNERLVQFGIAPLRKRSRRAAEED
jgi:hypothetical protein